MVIYAVKLLTVVGPEKIEDALSRGSGLTQNKGEIIQSKLFFGQLTIQSNLCENFFLFG
jgi:hypothetical protein